MKASKKKEIHLTTQPKDNPNFIGHRAITQTLTKILASGQVPQSWLICGPKGIGKATLAYRFTRALLSNNAGENLQIDSNDPTFRRIANGSHSDLLVIEPDDDKATKTISVDNIRNISNHLRLTASETKRRIIIIDSADDMNSNAANALLKLLEEPPSKAIFILISHAPGRLLPTIKSRCRKLSLNPLQENDASNILLSTIDELSPFEADKLSFLASGSPGVAIDLHYNNGIQIYDAITAILQTAPNIDNQLVQRLNDLVTKKDDKNAWEIMALILDGLLVRIIRNAAQQNDTKQTNNVENQLQNKLLIEKPLDQLIKIWEKINILVADTSRIHLDKKAVIVSIFEEFR